jgi:uncharacterized protein (DUF2461 family)
MSGADFSGFSKDTMRFFAELRRNNSRDWFEAHRAFVDLSTGIGYFLG